MERHNRLIFMPTMVTGIGIKARNASTFDTTPLELIEHANNIQMDPSRVLAPWQSGPSWNMPRLKAFVIESYGWNESHKAPGVIESFSPPY
jgi:hypothetical protein